MNRRLTRMVTRLYPPAWRERYGEEFAALLELGGNDLRTLADSVRSALWEHISPSRGGNMDQPGHSLGAVMKQPSAFLPLAMSLVALAMVLGDVAVHGRGPDGYNDTVEHLWQLLMLGQLPIMAFFAIRWLPRAGRPAVGVLAQQVGAAAVSVAAVFFLGLG